MSKKEEWNEFLSNLLNNAIQEYKQTKEYEYLKLQQNEIDRLLHDNLTEDQKELVEECIYDIGVASGHETEMFYQQGMKDCVWLLKNLGVISIFLDSELIIIYSLLR